MLTETEHHRNSEDPTYYHRRRGDGKVNWTALAVITGLGIQLVGWVWVASARNSDMLMMQASIAKLDGNMATLQNTTYSNSIRLGVVESKVDDLRDNQRAHQ